MLRFMFYVNNITYVMTKALFTLSNTLIKFNVNLFVNWIACKGSGKLEWLFYNEESFMNNDLENLEIF